MKSLAITLEQLASGNDKRRPNTPTEDDFSKAYFKARKEIEAAGFDNRMPALSDEIASYIAAVRLDSDLRGLLLTGNVGIGKTLAAKV